VNGQFWPFRRPTPRRWSRCSDEAAMATAIPEPGPLPPFPSAGPSPLAGRRRPPRRHRRDARFIDRIKKTKGVIGLAIGPQIFHGESSLTNPAESDELQQHYSFVSRGWLMGRVRPPFGLVTAKKARGGDIRYRAEPADRWGMRGGFRKYPFTHEYWLISTTANVTSPMPKSKGDSDAPNWPRGRGEGLARQAAG